MSNETDVVFESGNFTYQGTLILPDSHKKPPIVLSPGLGTVDRYENLERYCLLSLKPG